MACVYALVEDGHTDEIRYVGICKKDEPSLRLYQHIYNSKHNKKWHIYKWINKVITDGGVVKAIVLESMLSWEDANKQEMYWIKFYKDSGHKLTNGTSGGGGTLGWVPSQETKDRIGKANTGKVMPESAKQLLREANLGKRQSKETCEKKSISHKKRYEDPDARKKTSDQLRQRFESQEERDKISKKMTGVKKSPEHIARAAAANKAAGHKRSKEWKDAQSLLHKERHLRNKSS